MSPLSQLSTLLFVKIFFFSYPQGYSASTVLHIVLQKKKNPVKLNRA